jgi:hypothetical protein
MSSGLRSEVGRGGVAQVDGDGDRALGDGDGAVVVEVVPEAGDEAAGGLDAEGVEVGGDVADGGEDAMSRVFQPARLPGPLAGLVGVMAPWLVQWWSMR